MIQLYLRRYLRLLSVSEEKNPPHGNIWLFNLQRNDIAICWTSFAGTNDVNAILLYGSIIETQTLKVYSLTSNYQSTSLIP